MVFISAKYVDLDQRSLLKLNFTGRIFKPLSHPLLIWNKFVHVPRISVCVILFLL